MALIGNGVIKATEARSAPSLNRIQSERHLYDLLRADQTVVVVWRFYTLEHGALSVKMTGGLQTQG